MEGNWKSKIIDKKIFVNMIFQQILTHGYDQNFSYFVGDEGTKKIAIIDPINPEMLLPEIEKQGFKVTHLIATHGHFDHYGEIKDFYDTLLLRKLSEKLTLLFHESLKPKADIKNANYHLITKEEIFRIGNLEIQAIPTPGHEPGSVCFLVEKKLMTGDTLFINGCGRADLPGGEMHKLYDSLYNIIGQLPDDTLIYPGHNYGHAPFDTLKNQKESNLYLKCEDKDAFIKMRMGY